MQLEEWIDRYVQSHDLCPKYILHLHTCRRSFTAHAGDVSVESTTVEHLNAWAEYEATIHHKHGAQQAPHAGHAGPSCGRSWPPRAADWPAQATEGWGAQHKGIHSRR